MSTITVTNIKATGETASRAVSGVAAAWVGFKGTSTVSIDQGSANVASITDNATGDYTINFTNNMGSASTYILTGMAGLNTTSLKCVTQPRNLSAPTASSVRIQTPESDGGLSSDARSVFSAAHGDLA